MWNATLEAAASHPSQALLRLCVYHRSLTLHKAHDELVGVEVLPLWSLRPGFRAVELRDMADARLRLSKLVLHIEGRRELLPPLSVRQTYHKGEQERKQQQVMGELVAFAELRRDHGVFGFASRKTYISEGAGILRLTVRRLSGGDAAALLFFTTEDGSAQAGFDYEPQSGQLLFRKGVCCSRSRSRSSTTTRSSRQVLQRAAPVPRGIDLPLPRESVVIVDDDLLVEHIKRSSPTRSSRLPRPCSRSSATTCSCCCRRATTRGSTT